jgi:hypothetical protein
MNVRMTMNTDEHAGYGNTAVSPALDAPLCMAVGILLALEMHLGISFE